MDTSVKYSMFEGNEDYNLCMTSLSGVEQPLPVPVKIENFRHD